MPLEIIHGDITDLSVDAIVNPANVDLLAGGGVCGAIFSKGGADLMEAACKPLAPVPTGNAVITPGFDLPASWVIHTPGPIYDAHYPSECRYLLESCYQSVLDLARERGLSSVAFPLISAGIYGYPYKEALDVAIETIEKHMGNLAVTLCLYP